MTLIEALKRWLKTVEAENRARAAMEPARKAFNEAMSEEYKAREALNEAIPGPEDKEIALVYKGYVYVLKKHRVGTPYVQYWKVTN